MESRWQEIQSIWKSNQFLYVIAGFLAGILFFPAFEALNSNTSAFLANLVPEAIGLAFAVLVIDAIYQRRDHKQKIEEQKEQLIRQLNSKINQEAHRAAEKLEELGYLRDGTLAGRIIHEGNLANAAFQYSDLHGIRIQLANLYNADFTGANLENAIIFSANLEAASLGNARLC